MCKKQHLTIKEMPAIVWFAGIYYVLILNSVEPNGSRAFIGCTADNYVAIMDLRTLEVTSHIDAGGGLDGLTWAIR
jgi:hypothetical protein